MVCKDLEGGGCDLF